MIASCPHCKNRFYVPLELAGKTVNCARCNEPVQAPAKPAEVEGGGLALVAESNLDGMAVAEKRKKTMNLSRGFVRLAFVLSVIICLMLVVIDFPWLLARVCPVGRPAFWAAVIGGSWVVYGSILFIIRGFRDVKR